MTLPAGSPFKLRPPTQMPPPPLPLTTTVDAWTLTAWTNAFRGTPLNLTNMVLTFDEPFSDVSTITDGITGAGPWYAPARPDNTSLAKFQSPLTDPTIFTVVDEKLKIRMYNTGTEWRSGHLQTVNLNGSGFAQAYGYFEARIALDANVSWPAFWLYTRNRYTDAYAPRCEIDFEAYGDNVTSQSQHHSTVHRWPGLRVLPGYRPDHTSRADITTLNVANWGSNVNMFSGAFHTYGFLITPDWIIIYVDRVELKRIQTPGEGNQEFYMLLSLQMQDGFVAQAVETFMLVDYCRAYSVGAAPDLTIAGTPPTSVAVGDVYPGFTPSTAGGLTPYVFSVLGGGLPAGLTLDPATGAISGTATGPGTTGIVLRVTDDAGRITNLPAFDIAVTLEQETVDLLAQFDAPVSWDWQVAYNTLIKNLKTTAPAGTALWSKLGILYRLGGPASQPSRIDIKTPGQHTLAISGVPSFTAGDGFKGDGVSAYLGTGVAHNALPNFTQNTAHFGFYISEDPGPSDTDGISAPDNIWAAYIRPRNLAGNMVGRINATGADFTGAVGSALGHFCAVRTSSTASQFYKDGLLIGTSATTSVTPTSAEIRLLRGGTAGGSTLRRVAWWHAGTALTLAENAALCTILTDAHVEMTAL